MGRNKSISLLAAALLIIGLFLPFVKAIIDVSLFEAMSLPMGMGTLPIIIGIIVLLYAVFTFINKPLGARIMAIIVLLYVLYGIIGAAGFSLSLVGIGAWLMLVGSLLGALFSKADA